MLCFREPIEKGVVMMFNKAVLAVVCALLLSGAVNAETWTVNLVGTNVDYPKNLVTAFTGVGSLTVTRSGNNVEATFTITECSVGAVEFCNYTDGNFSGFGSAHTFGAANIESDLVDSIVGFIDIEGQIHGNINIIDLKFDATADSTTIAFTSDPVIDPVTPTPVVTSEPAVFTTSNNLLRIPDLRIDQIAKSYKLILRADAQFRFTIESATENP